MKKQQTKLALLVGVMSVAGAMTSFAATGWQQENGTWVYYDKNEEKVSQKWKKSGDYWYYLDDLGDMAKDSLIDDGNATYYVYANGVMVRNQWVAVPNTNDYDKDEPDQWWYYFGDNGKAYKRNKSSSSDVSLKTINGKKYAFDDKGGMISGLALFEMKQLPSGKYSTTEFVDKLGRDGKKIPYETQENIEESIGKIHYSEFLSGKYRMMYFGDGKDGSQKYGKQSIKLDDENRTFYFREAGSNRGAGFNGIRDDKLYIGGLNIKADQYDKYEVVVVDKSNDNQLVFKGTVGELLNMPGYVSSVEETEKKTTWHITTPNSNYQVKLLSNAGVVLKSGTKRDGEDYKIRVNNKAVTTVTLE